MTIKSHDDFMTGIVKKDFGLTSSVLIFIRN